MQTTITFPVEKVQGLLRHRAEKARQVREKGPEGWSKSEVSPMKLLFSFPSLRLKKGLVLCAYQFRSWYSGHGIVWAMPENLSFPDPKDCPRLKGRFIGRPRPSGALDDVMEAIEGDGSPWSYLSASIFAREIAEFGAMWHGCSWSTHVILGKDPWSFPQTSARRRPLPAPSGNLNDWRWLESKPLRWGPEVCADSSIVTVTFYTFSGLVREAIHRHVDTYKPGRYRSESEEKVIAEGPAGFLF